MSNDVPLQAIQNCEFLILKYIRDVCEQNGLRYYLAYGTLIGAVRHQGFIPWDDDMDIHMPREDYLKFVEVVQNNPHPFYRLLSKETSKKYSFIWAKVIDTRTKLEENTAWKEREKLGLFVDIFVLDGAGNSQKEAEDTYRKAFSIFRQYRRAVKRMYYPGESGFVSLLRWIYHIPQRILGVRYWINRHEAYCLQKDYDDCEYVAALGAGTDEPSRNVWKRAYFGKGTDVVFNGERFRAPDNWDAVLRPEYGDYWELPPLEAQRSNHPVTTLEITDPSFLVELLSRSN